MGLFDKLFGGKKSDQPADTNQGGEVNAPLSADDSQSLTDAAAPAVNNNVTISDSGQFTPPPSAVIPEIPAAEDTPAEEPAAEEPAAPAEPAEEAVQPGESTLETAPEADTSEEKTV